MIWVSTEKRADSDHAIRPEPSLPIKLGSRWMGPVGWFQGEQHVNLCQLQFCVSWALVGLFLWSHVPLGHQRNRDQTNILKYCRTSAFRVASLLWCHGWFRSGIWPPVAQGWDPISKPSMAFQKKHLSSRFSVQSNILAKVWVSPKCEELTNLCN